jgi:hypothetical protein
MKKLIVLIGALSLAGCASVPQLDRPMVHAVPKARAVAKPKVVSAPVVETPVVTVTPATPVPPGTFKMRWDAIKPKIHFFHQKKGN